MFLLQTYMSVDEVCCEGYEREDEDAECLPKCEDCGTGGKCI
ncbi:nimC2, partial [Drosophila busckii]